MANRNGRLVGAFLLIAIGASAAASAADSLYARLGGTPGVSAIVADTIDKVAADPEMSPSFDEANLQRMKELLTQQICTLTGGGCADRGDTLREVNSGYRLVEAMRESMRARGVPLAARNELLEILAPRNRNAGTR
jgi:hemoglobin